MHYASEDLEISGFLLKKNYSDPSLSLTGLDLLMEGLQGENCDYRRLEAWLPSLTKFFVTNIKLYEEDQLEENQQNYVNFVNVILKHLM